LGTNFILTPETSNLKHTASIVSGVGLVRTFQKITIFATIEILVAVDAWTVRARKGIQRSHFQDNKTEAQISRESHSSNQKVSY
jgi:ABC-type branched-subunit amino acid transport system ATPase component